MSEFNFDWQRAHRTGVAEAVLCGDKTTEQIEKIVLLAQKNRDSLLLTRLKCQDAERLCNEHDNIDWQPSSATAILNNDLADPVDSDCLIVTAGTSDVSVAEEAQRTLHFNGLSVRIIHDCGVAGLWRITDRLEELKQAPVIIAVAGMEGALFPVLAGLLPGLIIAVPGSTGYGVAEGGRAALSSALASCAPGVVVVNVDNGFGAACALVKILNQRQVKA